MSVENSAVCDRPTEVEVKTALNNPPQFRYDTPHHHAWVMTKLAQFGWNLLMTASGSFSPTPVLHAPPPACFKWIRRGSHNLSIRGFP
jgi:hypothetical protein